MGERHVTGSDISLLQHIVGLTWHAAADDPRTRATDRTFQVLDLLEELLGSDWTAFHAAADAPAGAFRRVYQQATGQGEHLLCLARRSVRLLITREAGRPFRLRELTLMQLLLPHLVSLGMPNKQIGRRLGISEGTVRKHLEHAYQRRGVQSRTEAVSRLHGQTGASTAAGSGPEERGSGARSWRRPPRTAASSPQR